MNEMCKPVQVHVVSHVTYVLFVHVLSKTYYIWIKTIHVLLCDNLSGEDMSIFVLSVSFQQRVN